MRIVGGIKQLRFRIDDPHGLLEQPMIGDLHWLRGEIHVAHIVGRQLLERGSFRGAHHVFVVEALHHERHPGEPALEPHHLQLGKALGQAVDDPVGEMDHVVPDEAERMHRDEAVEHALGLVVPVIGAVECDRQAHLLQQRIGLHVLVGVHRTVPGRRDQEADHALLLAELLDELVARLGVVERQIEHGYEPLLAREHFFAEPAIIGAR